MVNMVDDLATMEHFCGHCGQSHPLARRCRQERRYTGLWLVTAFAGIVFAFGVLDALLT